ncbi:hypothetical protein [Serratia inhibens]|uniref:hypothetical protein n=1 Tax=Serratia inhibens TaxID=2338073 RepID=UPI003217CFE0
MKALAGKNQMSYGGDGGFFNSVQDTGGQQVVIKSGSKIDPIQIGNNKYGGGGGGTIRLISCSAGKWMGWKPSPIRSIGRWRPIPTVAISIAEVVNGTVTPVSYRPV